MNLPVKFYIKNYKEIQEADLSFEGELMLITAPNGKGKTSLVTAIHEAFMVKSLTPEPLRKGEQEGMKKVTLPDINGNPITVIHKFDEINQIGQFYAIDHNGKIINNDRTIKGLLGSYAPLTVEKFFSGMTTPEGRRKLVKDYLLPLMGSGAERIIEINKMVNERGTLFTKRTEKNVSLKSWNTVLEKNNPLNPEEEAFLKKLPEFQQDYDNIKAKLIADEQDNYVAIAFVNYCKRIKNTINSDRTLGILTENENPFVSEINVVLDKYIKSYEQSIKETEANIAKQKIDLANGDLVIATCAGYQQRFDSAEKSKKEVEALTREIEEINNDMIKLKDERSVLLSKATLPKGLTTDGENIQIDGFDFVAEQISGAKAMIAIADIMAQLFTGKIIVVGSITEFDKYSLRQISEIALKYNKIVALTKVVDEGLVGIEAVIQG